MFYSKPSITAVGNAPALIQGSGSSHESNSKLAGNTSNPDTELDD